MSYLSRTPVSREQQRSAGRRAAKVRRDIQARHLRELDEKGAALAVTRDPAARSALLAEIASIRLLLKNPLIAGPAVRQRGKLAQIVRARRRERMTLLPSRLKS
jgi:hypothetical protein